METLPIRVLLADDHTIVRSGVRALLSTEPDIEVVSEVGNGAEAVAQAETLRPDVILMDLVMPGLSGIEATRQITASLPGTRVSVSWMYCGSLHKEAATETLRQSWL